MDTPNQARPSSATHPDPAKGTPGDPDALGAGPPSAWWHRELAHIVSCVDEIIANYELGKALYRHGSPEYTRIQAGLDEHRWFRALVIGLRFRARNAEHENISRHD